MLSRPGSIEYELASARAAVEGLKRRGELQLDKRLEALPRST